MKMKKLILPYLLSFFSVYSIAQKSVTQTIYFKSNEYELSKVQKSQLAEMFFDEVIQSIQINGHTDSVGSHVANLELSKKRVEAVTNYFEELGIDRSNIQMQYFGESQPVQSNKNEAGRSANRRVSVALIYLQKKESDEMVVEVQEDSLVNIDPVAIQLDNSQLYRKLGFQNKVQEFTIYPFRDTALQTADGLIFYFGKNAFETSCANDVQIQIIEYNNRQSMLQGNTQTMSNGKQIFSVGMFDIRAFCEGLPVDLKNKNTYAVMVPIEKNTIPFRNVQCFYGERDSLTEEVNWIVDSSGQVKNYRGSLLCGGAIASTDKRICFLKKWFMSRRRKLSRAQKVEIARRREQIQNRMKSVDFNQIGALPRSDLSYYVFQPRKMGLVNYDIFWKENTKNLIVQRVKIDQTITHDTDVKMVFKRRKSLVSPTKVTPEYFEFADIPKGEIVFLVGLKMDESDLPQLGIQKVTTSNDEVHISLEDITSIEEMDRRLRVVN